MRLLYAHNVNLTEAEFLHREFDLKLTEINSGNEQELRNLEVVLLATTDPKELTSLIQGRKEQSVIVFFLGNETYDIPKFEYLNNFKKEIRHCFIYNLPKKTPYSVSVKCFFATVYDGGLFHRMPNGNILRHAKNGFDFMRRNRRIRLDYSSSNFPQGYTNTFVSELKTVAHVDHRSLFRNENLSEMSRNQRTKVINFIGAEGSWNRKLAIKKMKRIFPDSDFSLVASSWTNKKPINANSIVLSGNYVSSLVNSKFTLCPPGNLTNQTYRYLESLLLGSLPILPPATIQDNHLWNCWSEFTKPTYYSWKLNLRRAKNMPEDERLRLVTFGLSAEKIRIENTKNLLLKILNQV